MKVTLFRPANGRGNYYVKWRVNGVERRKSLRTRDKHLAVRIRDEMEKLAVEEEFGLISEDLDFTPEDAWDEYVKISQKKPHTLDTEKCFWDQFFSFCGALTLRSVRRVDVVAWQKHLIAEGNAVTTINDKLRQVCTVWNWLNREEVFSGPNPFAGRRKLSEGPRKIRVIPWEKVQGLLNAAQREMEQAQQAVTDAMAKEQPWLRLQRTADTARALYLSLVLAAYSGLRKAEALAVRWDDIDWGAEVIEVRGTKTAASSAKLHLHPTLRDALYPYRRDSGYVVRPGKEEGRARYRTDLKKEWQALREKAGLPDARLHDLRHSFATRLLDLDYSLKDIAVMLRHASLKTTEIYADLRTVKVKIGSLDYGYSHSKDCA